MKKYLIIALAFTISAFTMLVSSSYAEPFSISPVRVPSEVANFPLNEKFLQKVEDVHKEMENLPPEPDNPRYGNDTSMDGIILLIEDKPKMMEVLKRNDLTAHDYVLGGMTLAASLSAASAEGEDQFFDETLAVSKANLKFGKRYADRIRILLGE